MNGKKGSIEIKIPDSIAKGKQPEKKSEIIFSWQGWFVSVWEFCKQDPKRVIFSLKVGLAVLLVSLLILLPEPYQVFGPNIIWSILTVAIMFEYTVGSTFNRGFNRAVGSLLAGALAIVIAQVALSTGHIGEPIIIGISLFLVGIVTSFMKIWPALVQYEYGFRVMLFTYCLIIVSGYRVGNPIKMSMDRLYSIAIGAIIAVLVNVLVCPIWAGDQLHRELVSNFNSVADSLEECVGKYLEVDGLDHPEFTKTVADDFPDEPAYKKCHATLNSSAKLESLANSAKWEPPHGRFCHFFYPWSEYVKVGAVLRYCAYEVMALHGVLHSEIQAPYNLRITFQKEIQEATSQAAELVRCLGKDISSMKQSLKVSILANLHCSTERLQRAITMHSYLFTPNFEIPKASSKQIPNSSYNNPDDEFSKQLADLNSTKPTDHNSQQSETHTESYSYHDEKLSHSMEIDAALEEKEGYGVDYCIPKLKAFERSAALSLPTFTSLLVEFVARLEHLVEAVDQLSKLAKFAPPQPAAQ